MELINEDIIMPENEVIEIELLEAVDLEVKTKDGQSVRLWVNDPYFDLSGIQNTGEGELTLELKP